MNHISHISTNNFNELDANELTEVYNAFCDENKYFDCRLKRPLSSRRNVVVFIVNNCVPIEKIASFFNYWKH